MNSWWSSWRLGRLARLVLVLFFGAAAVAAVARAVGADWRTASREPTGIAPNPATTREAVVQVYAARAWGWRGAFGVHSWIAVKPTAAPAFTIYQVIGWRAYYGGSALVIDQRAPDARWFGAEPELLADMRGPGVDKVIEKIDTAARSYPYPDEYHVWPGPNSNTFVAYVARQVPELRLDLPPTAIGKDYIPGGRAFARSPSGTGYQLSLFGILGVLAGAEEGLEINLLGLTFGVDPMDFAVKLPIVGRIGPNNNHRVGTLP
jgi:hypothetical protein